MRILARASAVHAVFVWTTIAVLCAFGDSWASVIGAPVMGAAAVVAAEMLWDRKLKWHVAVPAAVVALCMSVALTPLTLKALISLTPYDSPPRLFVVVMGEFAPLVAVSLLALMVLAGTASVRFTSATGRLVAVFAAIVSVLGVMASVRWPIGENEGANWFFFAAALPIVYAIIWACLRSLLEHRHASSHSSGAPPVR